MSRPKKCRTITDFPNFWSFSPDNGVKGSITLTLDEYEAILQIDHLGKTQEETAKLMNVARTTITSIYDSARKKISELLVNGKRLEIAGGNYDINYSYNIDINKKKNDVTRIAVSYKEGLVFQSFGLTEVFKFYDVCSGEVINEQIIRVDGPNIRSYAGLLKSVDTDILICDIIGFNAKRSIDEANIKLYSNLSGEADKIVKEFINDHLI